MYLLVLEGAALGERLREGRAPSDALKPAILQVRVQLPIARLCHAGDNGQQP